MIARPTLSGGPAIYLIDIPCEFPNLPAMTLLKALSEWCNGILVPLCEGIEV